MQRADRQTLVEIAAAAPLFAEAWANASERTGQRQALGDHLHGAAIIARGNAIDEARDVETRRAAGRAWRYALAGVIGKQQLDRKSPGCRDPPGSGPRMALRTRRRDRKAAVPAPFSEQCEIGRASCRERG